jgi:polyketide synthase PksL
MAEFVSLLGKPMRDPVLNTTVHTAQEWAEVLGENGLALQDVVDLSPGIANFLQDPDLERHIAGLEKARQAELRKYNRQVAGLENQWVCYCAMRVVKDRRQAPVEERIRQNRERLNQRIPFQLACAQMAESPSADLYRDMVGHFQDCVAPAGRPLPLHFDHGS